MNRQPRVELENKIPITVMRSESTVAALDRWRVVDVNFEKDRPAAVEAILNLYFAAEKGRSK